MAKSWEGETSVRPGTQLTLPLSEASPFHFVLDRELRLVSFGRSLAKLCRNPTVGDFFHDHLVIRRPDTTLDFRGMAALEHQLFLFETMATGAVLRGSIRKRPEDLLVFIGSPWLTAASEVERLGLTLGDFSLHCPALDLLQVLQAQQQMNVDLQQLNERLAQAKVEAEAATQSKSAFLAQISHELRTPMNAVIGLTGILMEDESLNGEQRDLVQTIRSSGDGLLSIINEVLDFSKIESGHFELDDAPYGIRRCAEDSLDLVSVEASRKGLDLACWIDPGSPVALRGDGTRVRQVLLNLLANAVRFTDSGRVVLRAEPCASSERFRWIVEDTGSGIPDTHLGSIFEPFEQVSAGIRRKVAGTGLGLTISKRLAERMGGDLTVESHLGMGSRFTLSLPAIAATITSGSSLPAASAMGRRVLVYEPRGAHARQLVQLLQQLGATTTLVGDWEQLVSLARSGLGDVILASAADAADLAKLAGLHQAEQVSLVACVPPELRSAGMGVRTLRKPVRLDALSRTLAEVTSERAPRRPKDSSPPRSLAPLRVLLAEDSVVNQLVARLQLARLGITPDVVSNGLEALAAVERRDYDVVLMDVQMPECDGLDATRRIRELPIRQPFIVALTASAFEDERETCRRAGMEFFVSKPIDMDLLAHVLERCAGANVPSHIA